MTRSTRIRHRLLRRYKFDPRLIFANNDLGIIYDHSDLTTLYKEQEGLARVSLDGEIIGLRLDKSKNLSPVDNIGALIPPNGFGWTPPVKIFKSAGGVFTTDFNANDWKVSATASLYVSTAGNDTTGDGSEILPYRTIKKALQVAATLPDTDLNIFVASGEYGFNAHFSGTSCPKNLNIIATGGRVLCTNKFAISSWTADGAGTYKTTRAGIADVRDSKYPVTWPNGETTPQHLTKVADVATCQATPSSWYTDNTTVWVHLQDGRVPDANAGQDVGLIYGSISALLSTNQKWFVQGFDFEGSNGNLFGVSAGNGVTVERVVIDDCTFRFQGNNGYKSVSLLSVALGIIHNCRSYDSVGDGFSYSRFALGSSSTNAIEINCHAYKCGNAETSAGIINGSTNHADGKVVRINCVYRDTYGPVVADINNTRNWMLGIDADSSLLGDNSLNDSIIQAGVESGERAISWLDNCTVGSSAHYRYYAGGSCGIRVRDTTIDGVTNGNISDTYIAVAGNHASNSVVNEQPMYQSNPARIEYDGVNDKLKTTFQDLGSNVTIARSIPGTGAQILTGQTIGAGVWTDNIDSCALIIINRSLSIKETADLTSWLNAKAGI